jgi:hypothetical protein
VAATLLAAASLGGASPAQAAVPAFSDGYESGSCSAWSQGCKVSGSGRYSIGSSGAYDGTRFLRATVGASSVIDFARSQTDISIGLGQEFWFGAAVRLQPGFYNAGGQVRLFAWDAYPASPDQRGGIWIDSTGRVVAYHMGRSGQVPLVVLGNRALPEGVWTFVEFRQRLSTSDGNALTEVYVNGSLIGSSTLHNTDGPSVTRFRVGITDGSDVRTTVTADFDRAYIGPTRLGPKGSTTSGGSTTTGSTGGSTTGTSGGTTSASAPTFRGSSSNATTVPTSALTLRPPSGTSAGDVMLAVVATNHYGSTSITAPPGWTRVRGDSSTSGGALSVAIFSRVATSAEAASHTFALGATVSAAGAIMAYHGVDAVRPVDASSGNLAAWARSVTAPSVQTSQASERLLAVYASSGRLSFTPPAGMTERFDTHTSDTYRNVTLEVSDAVTGSSGPTGSKVGTSSGVPAIASGQLVALRHPN